MKINKSQIARELGVDVRTVGKYINGYQKPNTRKRSSKIDKFYLLLKNFLVMNQYKCFTIKEYYGNI